MQVVCLEKKHPYNGIYISYDFPSSKLHLPTDFGWKRLLKGEAYIPCHRIIFMSNNIGFWTRKLEENERKILPENFRLLRRHVRKLLAGNVRERTVVNHIQLLLPFAMWCEIDYKSLDEDDIFDYCDHLMEKTYTRGCQPKRYSSSTVYAHKTCVKTFLKNINPSASDAIVLKKSKREIPEILTKDDVLAMINASLTARDRALVSCLFESGARQRVSNPRYRVAGMIGHFPCCFS